MEIRHLLFMETGGHDWSPIKSSCTFTDPTGAAFIVEKCTQCGITAQRYFAMGGDKKGRGDGLMDTLYIGPQYPRNYAMKCPEEMGLFKHPQDEPLVAVLGEDVSKKKKKKKDKKKWKKIKNVKHLEKPKKVKKIKRTRNSSNKEIKRIRRS